MIVAKKEGAYAVTFESAALPNLGYEFERYLGPGEIVLVTADGVEQKMPPGDELRICSFLWLLRFGVEFGGLNVEVVRNRGRGPG